MKEMQKMTKDLKTLVVGSGADSRIGREPQNAAVEMRPTSSSW